MAVGPVAFEDDLDVDRITLQRFLAVFANLVAGQDFIDLRPTVGAIRSVELRALRQKKNPRPSICAIVSAREQNQSCVGCVII